MGPEKGGELCEEIALRYQYSYIFYKKSLVYNCNTQLKKANYFKNSKMKGYHNQKLLKWSHTSGL